MQHLSAEPVIQPDLLTDLKGAYGIKVCAVNHAGPGQFARTTAILTGIKGLFNPINQNVFNIEGSKHLSPGKYDEVQDISPLPNYCSFWEEHIFVSDHNDSPKVKIDPLLVILLKLPDIFFVKDWRSIRACVLTALDNIRHKHGRSVDRIYHVTDTGGENWGTQVSHQSIHPSTNTHTLTIYLRLCLCTPGVWRILMHYLYGALHLQITLVSFLNTCMDKGNSFNMYILGQPSDSTGGTFKRYLTNEAKAGNCKYNITNI